MLSVGFNRYDLLFVAAVSQESSYYGAPEYVCRACGAFYWYHEACKRRNDSGPRFPLYTGCCRGGRISLPMFRDWPSPLKELLRFDGGPESTRFLRLIRHYNSMFSFTSIGAQVDHSVNVGGGPYVFKMNGVVYHRIGSLFPDEGRPPKYAQL